MYEIPVQKQGWETKYECLCQGLLDWYKHADNRTEYVPVIGSIWSPEFYLLIPWKLKIDSWINRKEL